MGRRARLVALCVGLTVTCLPRSSAAWGFAAHRLVMQRAIDLLPPELRPFFAQHGDEIVLRVVDPDLWRTVGWDEDPNHFLDFGVEEYGPYPFAALPREHGAALEKFGAAVLKRNGTLPWRAAEMTGNLRREFDAHRRQAPYTVSNTILFAAVTSHYVQDAYQPLHATDEFDGQRTGQRGVHARFERDLIERFQSRLSLMPASPTLIANARDAVFDALIAGHQLVDDILRADKDALAGRDTYDARYFEAFFQKVKPLLERRLAEAATVTAGVILGAWHQAGRPALRTRDVRPVERSRPR